MVHYYFRWVFRNLCRTRMIFWPQIFNKFIVHCSEWPGQNRDADDFSEERRMGSNHLSGLCLAKKGLQLLTVQVSLILSLFSVLIWCVLGGKTKFYLKNISCTFSHGKFLLLSVDKSKCLGFICGKSQVRERTWGSSLPSSMERLRCLISHLEETLQVTLSSSMLPNPSLEATFEKHVWEKFIYAQKLAETKQKNNNFEPYEQQDSCVQLTILHKLPLKLIIFAIFCNSVDEGMNTI